MTRRGGGCDEGLGQGVVWRKGGVCVHVSVCVCEVMMGCVMGALTSVAKEQPTAPYGTLRPCYPTTHGAHTPPDPHHLPTTTLRPRVNAGDAHYHCTRPEFK